MKYLKFIIFSFILVVACESYSQITPISDNDTFLNDAEFVVGDKSITIFKAIGYNKYYPNIVYRIKNTGTTILNVIYANEIMELKPLNSIDLTVENKDLKVESQNSTTEKGSGTYRIVYVVK